MAQVEVESWDEDADFQGDLFSHSLSTQPTSLSSRQSVRSESNAADEDWQVLITPNDDTSTTNAISSAKQFGIPIPHNVPQSALLGGTIKRLGKTKAKKHVADDWGDDFDMGGDDIGGGLQLKVGPQQNAPVTPSNNGTDDDFDTEWAEGSLGIRFGGTRRELRGRTSSVSAMSPSLGSCMTVESEDDDLGGLVLPTEPIDFAAKLRQRQEREQEERKEIPTSAPIAAAWDEPRVSSLRTPADEDDDMLSGLDFDDASDFLENPKKRTINRNVKIESARVQAPAARSATTSLTFTDKPALSRIPRPSNSATKIKLDPVYESGAASHSSIPPPQLMRFGRTPTTTSAQLLRSKRSAPALGRPPTSLASSRPPVPFLPAGVSTNKSQHVNAKGSMHFRQPSDHHSRPISPPARSFSRMSIAEQVRNTPSRAAARRSGVSGIAPAALARVAANQQTLHVQKRRVFGHGNELDSFDDLPTSVTKEQKFMKTPVSTGPPRTLRRKDSRANLNLMLPERSQMVTPAPSSTVPSTPQAPPTPSSRGYFPGRTENLPRFARDTAASRIAREQRLAGGSNPRPKSDGPVPPAMNINWKAQVAARSPHHSPTAARGKKRDIKGPMLIKNMSSNNNLKNEKGMVYNAVLQQWEGNEHILTHFSNPSNTTLPLHPTHTTNHSHHHHTKSVPSGLALGFRDQNTLPRHGSPPRPALISQVSQARGPRIERGMVFDPDRMKWLKVDPRTFADPSKALSPGSVSIEDEEDPFAGIDDLPDESRKITPGAGGANKENEGVGGGAAMGDEWALGEEFDLGPTFIKRQRIEETEWRKWAGEWFPNGEAWVDERGAEEWKWSIRGVVAERCER